MEWNSLHRMMVTVTSTGSRRGRVGVASGLLPMPFLYTLQDGVGDRWEVHQVVAKQF